MNTDEISQLPDEQLRVMVAEACGWKRKPEFDYKTTKKPDGVAIWGRDDGKLIHSILLPDYPTSIDACAEFERGLNESESDSYDDLLVFAAYYVWRATARQRCVAFLKVKGKL